MFHISLSFSLLLQQLKFDSLPGGKKLLVFFLSRGALFLGFSCLDTQDKNKSKQCLGCCNGG